VSDIKEALDKLQIERNRVGARAELEPAEATQPLVVFMTPALDHCVTLGYLKSYVETAALLSLHGWATSFQSFGGDPYLAKVRNLLVSTCLKRFPAATDLFFLDADLEWDAPSVLRSVQHPADIVAGVYPKKTDKPDFPCDLMAEKESGKLIEKDGLYRAVMVPTGFLRVRRHVYAAMAAQSLRYQDGTGNNEECWNIFEMGFHAEKQPNGMDGQWWGEDYAWCRKAQEMGYEIYVDPNVVFGHRGAKTWRYEFKHAVESYRDGKAEVKDRRVPEGAAAKAPVGEPGAVSDAYEAAPLAAE